MAPVAIYMPILFSCPSHTMVSEGVHRLVTLGYHVITPASPLCHELQALRPVANTGQVEIEAKAAASPIEGALNLIPRALLPGSGHTVSALCGESYGALVGAALLAQGLVSLSPQAPVLLVSPPT